MVNVSKCQNKQKYGKTLYVRQYFEAFPENADYFYRPCYPFVREGSQDQRCQETCLCLAVCLSRLSV